MKRCLLLILMLIPLFLSGCFGKLIAKPTVTIDGVSVKDFTLQKLDLDVRVTIYNPNPIGITLRKIVFDIYYLDGQPKYLGHGEKKNIGIRSEGKTTVTIPVEVSNSRLIDALLKARKGEIKLKVNGSVYLDLKVTTFEIPFEEEIVVTVPTPTAMLT